MHVPGRACTLAPAASGLVQNFRPPSHSTNELDFFLRQPDVGLYRILQGDNFSTISTLVPCMSARCIQSELKYVHLRPRENRRDMLSRADIPEK